uniref:Ig-like domain-containing protein n=1 Tax=Acanthochromis polyacanthus TaxID=80966 RepID=A0A3Q1GFB9_9TELE
MFLFNITNMHSNAAGVRVSCPIELSPTGVVVKYGDPVLVNCSTPEIQFYGLGWEASQGGTGLEVVNLLPWTVERLTEWTISPFCFFSSESSGQCIKHLHLIIYTFPETIYISGDPSSEMEVEKEYKFTCHIPNVAPVQNLTVRWYKGGAIIQTDTFDNPAKQPVNQTSDLKFIPTRQDNSASLRCEAYMDLSPDGPQLNVSTQEYNITVVCMYIIAHFTNPFHSLFLYTIKVRLCSFKPHICKSHFSCLFCFHFRSK